MRKCSFFVSKLGSNQLHSSLIKESSYIHHCMVEVKHLWLTVAFQIIGSASLQKDKRSSSLENGTYLNVEPIMEKLKQIPI